MKACADCPFKVDSELSGSPDWLRDIMQYHYANKYFEHSCHKTDSNADGYVGGQKKKECRGHLKMIMNECDNTPGAGGVYDSIPKLIETYLTKWLGKAALEKMRLKL